jgi:YidC/Oxa1 family membrane protein insertase
MLVDVLRQVLFLLAHQLDGSLGSAIVVVSLGARLLLLPLTIRAALAARAQQARLALLQPDHERLRKRHSGDPLKLAESTQALHRQHGISLLPKGTLIPVLVQIPLGAALYQAIVKGVATRQRYLWIRDLARPDLFVTGVVGVFAAVGSYAAAGGQASAGAQTGMTTTTAVLISALAAVAFAYRIAAGVGVYWAASSLVGVLQSVIVRQVASRQLRAVGP